MKKLVLLTLLAPVILFGQEDSTDANNKKCIKVISISAYAGGDIYRDGFEDRTLFQQAQPGQAIMFADLSGYSNQQSYFMYRMPSSSITTGLQVSTRLRCQKKFSELRFGISHSISTVSNLYYSKETTTPLGSSTLPGGEVIYTDSIYHSQYAYNWTSDFIGVNAAWIVKSDPGKIFSCYTGLSINGGFGYNGIITAERIDYTYLNSYSQGQGGGYYSSSQRVVVDNYGQYRAPVITELGASIPIGFNIRLGKRHSFFSHLMMYGEYQGSFVYLQPSGTDAKVRTASRMYGGLRYYIHAPKYVKKHDREGNRLRRGYSHGEEHLQH